MPTTTNYGWTTPADTDLVKDGASAIRTLGSSIDSTVFSNASAGIAKTIVDAKGDLIAGTASDTVARLAVGSNDQILVADSTAATGLKWATPSSGGGMTLLSTTTLTGTTVSISSISQSYKNLYFVIRNFKGVTDGAVMRIRFNGDTGSSRHRSELFKTQSYYDTPFTFNQTYSRISAPTDSSVSNGIITFTIPDYTNTSTYKVGYYEAVGTDYTTNTQMSYLAGTAVYNQTVAITSMDFITDGGDFTSGTILLYGVN